MTFTIRPFVDADRASCASILAALPEWFGIAETNDAYIAGLAPQNALVVVDGDQEVVAFLGLVDHGDDSWEIAVMGVRRALHRLGIGRRLVGDAIADVRRRGGRWLHVKTRGPATYDDDYERTRRFYRALGFAPLYESLTEWGDQDAALIFVMALGEREV
ncbi:MAG: GNAT family N-acetyltransferase [Actinomycetota bacterium]